MTGEKILNYRIENLTGENQVFRSFLATHLQFNKKVIIKALNRINNPEDKIVLLDEIKKLAYLQHPNVITLYDHLETAEEFYLIFEHIEGKTLSDYVSQVSGPIPEDKTRKLFIKILQAFQLAHQKGIINGAINPSNIIITEDEDIKVLDLALSNFYVEKAFDIQDVDSIIYLSPEKLKQESTDRRSDIYSLGLILFYMLAGKFPYPLTDLDEVKSQLTENNLPPIKEFYPMVSEGIQNIVDKATAKNPSDRFQTVEEFIQSLMKIEKTKEDEKLKQVEQKRTKSQETLNVKEPLESRHINLPVILLVLFVAIAVYMIWQYNRPERTSNHQLILTNEDEITEKQDSLAKVREQKAIEDSIRILKMANKVKTSDMHFHKVGRNENWASIAKRYYVNVDSLKKWNGVKGNPRLKRMEGIHIKVRARYKIKRGENIFTVAKKFDINPNVLKIANRLYPKPVEEGEEPVPVIYEGKNIIIPIIAKK